MMVGAAKRGQVLLICLGLCALVSSGGTSAPASAQTPEDEGALLEMCISRLDAAAREVEDLTGQVSSKLDRCEKAQKKEVSRWRELVEVPMRKWLSENRPAETSCESLSYRVTGPGQFRLEGEISDISALQESLEPIRAVLPGLEISFEGLNRVSRCLEVISVADGVQWGFYVPVSGEGPSSDSQDYQDIVDDTEKISELPPERLCSTIGEGINEYKANVDPELALRAFWVRLEDGRLGLCDELWPSLSDPWDIKREEFRKDDTGLIVQKGERAQ